MSFEGWARDTVDRVQSWGFLYRYYEKRLLSRLDPVALPRHVAVLADGNRRWARANAPGRPLVIGYQAGADKLKEFVGWCAELGIPLVTLWVLSTDNLRRSEEAEITPLLDVIERLVTDLASTGDYRVQVVGDPALLPTEMAANLRAAEQATANKTGCHVNVAIAYGGRHELRDAVRSLLASEAEKGTSLGDLSDNLEIDDISGHLYTAGQPDPDLIIRTSGEQRLSGFLIWQSAHSEFYFCEALWPDFRKIDFVRALRSYAQRERRFGT
ncbi:isoprenyl transferase [Propionicimonas sp.]|uniref:isoprenyl transferase n=1 Tax=Propionicimonas sp. TaxID=1955623 RepID=UPI00180E7729|nr:isoprenyl transferase [Propionicimonas sp.]MBU3976449.1 isoprenyl transferase [Actinomycetota bacterium]MBA3020289.1 isoprenyl transferase [Propionicimonas sp.]MBU3986076.1 isoprenyl transferase [Actinomycetota bacterium]MBU4007593.1 isoprenyl transferase [Actinomycetota bacterium]MBU4064374.1 isoprenyl transferase [Actinomycetota bacterium]